MSSKKDFDLFLNNIRPTSEQKSELRVGHLDLREKLRADEDLTDILVSDFLQGSYRRATALRPKGEQEPRDASDVDIVVVTNLSEETVTPEQAIDHFIPFCEQHYQGRYVRQGRSIGIQLDTIKMDLVVTSAPSETQEPAMRELSQNEDLETVMEWRRSRLSAGFSQPYLYEFLTRAQGDWKPEPLRIPDCEADHWVSTHPLDQIVRTWEKSKATHGHYVNVVKALKWWRMEQNADVPTHPKSYPLERFLFETCPNGLDSVAESVVGTLEAIRDTFAPYRFEYGKPILHDLGLLEHGIRLDVFESVTSDLYSSFYSQAREAADIARRALEAEERSEQRRLWRILFGDSYPSPSDAENDDGDPSGALGAFSPRTEPTQSIGGGRFA